MERDGGWCALPYKLGIYLYSNFFLLLFFFSLTPIHQLLGCKHSRDNLVFFQLTVFKKQVCSVSCPCSFPRTCEKWWISLAALALTPFALRFQEFYSAFQVSAGKSLEGNTLCLSQGEEWDPLLKGCHCSSPTDERKKMGAMTCFFLFCCES